MALAAIVNLSQYSAREQTHEITHYFLKLEDIGPNDVTLYQIVENGLLKVGIPFSDKDESSSEYLSQSIGGSYLQALINNQYDVKNHLHRSLTQFREIREFAQLKGIKFNSLEEAAALWISEEQAKDFEETYKRDFVIS